MCIRDSIYITTTFGANLVVANRATGQVLDEWLDPIQTPTDLLIAENRIIVSSANFNGDVYGPGKVTAYDRDGAVIWSVTSEEKNPQFLAWRDDVLWVVNSGEFKSQDGTFVAGTPSSIELFDIDGIRLAHYPLPENDADPFAGSLGRPMFVDDDVYFSSGTGPYLFKFNRTSERLSLIHI